MERRRLAAFCDELVKIAVSAADLRVATERIAPLRRLPAKAWEELGTTPMRAGAFHIPKRLPEAIKDQSPALARAAGAVYVAPSAGRGIAPHASREAQTNLRGIATIHEAAERKAGRYGEKLTELVSGHAEPDVLVQESNLINTLEGPGGGWETAGLWRRLREPEYRRLSRQASEAFGDARAGGFVGRPGQKMPKAMRRRFRALLERSVDRRDLEYSQIQDAYREQLQSRGPQEAMRWLKPRLSAHESKYLWLDAPTPRHFG